MGHFYRQNKAVCREIESLSKAINDIKESCHIDFWCLFWYGLCFFGTLAWHLVSSVGLQAYNSKGKVQRNLFDFHFQVKRVSFPSAHKNP